jgi:thiol-disulfide isomerase/thioredoxin
MATSAALAMVGKQSPDIKLQVFSKTGETSRTTLFKLMSNGLPTVIDFFTTWCKACPDAAKKLEALTSNMQGEPTSSLCVLRVKTAW